MVVHFYYKIRNVHVYNVNYEIEREQYFVQWELFKQKK